MKFNDLKVGMVFFERYDKPWENTVYIITKKDSYYIYCKSFSFGGEPKFTNEIISKTNLYYSGVFGSDLKEVKSSDLMREIIEGVF